MAACAFPASAARKWRREGVASLFPLGDLAIIGFAVDPAQAADNPAAHPRDRRRGDRRQARRAGDHRQPRLHPSRGAPRARRARRISRSSIMSRPSVWAWRPGRASAMRAYVDHVLALLPFEPAAHARLGGPPCTYVGHPLAEQIERAAAGCRRRRARRLADPPLLLVLPGSRAGEIRRMAAIFGEAVGAWPSAPARWRWWCRRCRSSPRRCAAAVAGWPVPAARRDRPEPRNRRPSGMARAALDQIGHLDAGTCARRRADGRGLQGLAARGDWSRAPADQGPHASILANLVLGENVVPEFLQRDCTAEQACRRLAAAARPIRRSAAARLPPLPGSTTSWSIGQASPQRPGRRRRSWSSPGTLNQSGAESVASIRQAA